MSDDMPKRIEVIFQDATHNLRFFKQQQWTVTNYALAAYAALIRGSAHCEQVGPPRKSDCHRRHRLVPLTALWFCRAYIDLFENLEAALNGFMKNTLSVRSA